MTRQEDMTKTQTATFTSNLKVGAVYLLLSALPLLALKKSE